MWPHRELMAGQHRGSDSWASLGSRWLGGIGDRKVKM